MARSPEATAILEAAERWKDECLLGEGSIFTHESLWTLPNARALETHFTKNLDEGEGDFFQKFEGQLSPAPATAVRLAAEMLWAMYLIVSPKASSGATKRLQIRRVFSWSGSEVDPDHWALGDLLDAGVAHPGTAYNTHRWREVVFFIDFLLRWTPLEPEQRARLLADPWEFSSWLDGVEGAAQRQLPHILCYLLFPDTFERIASGRHKRDIVRKFSGDAAEVTSYSSRTELDRAVLAVRESLSGEYGENLDFYRDPIVEQWRPTSPPPPPTLDQTPDDVAWLENEFGGHRVWILAAGQGGRLWPDFKRHGIAAIGWDFLDDLDGYLSREEISSVLEEELGRANPMNDSLAAWEFSHVIQEGDTILARKGADTLLAHGVVKGPYVFDDERAEFKHTRSVEWTPVEKWRIPADRRVANKTLTDFTKYPTWVRDAFGWIGEVPTVGPGEEDYSFEDAINGLFLPEDDFRGVLDALAARKNLILQGPPGVGKTFIARRIAWALIRRKARANVEFVQFHQSYAYEDFIQGFRPRVEGGFELRDGVFHQFCRRAADSDEPHVFIIDEINRGNLSRIFGELMMLIEADKRGPDHSIPLTYSPEGDRFFVPENVYVLGMMNTADRSLALVDYALRRRFAFFSLRAAFGSEKFSRHLLQQGVEERVVRMIDSRMRALNQSIRDDAQNLGPGFEIGHSYFVPSGDEDALDEDWYRSIVRTQILPLLKEYWFDRPDVVAKHAEALGVS